MSEVSTLCDINNEQEEQSERSSVNETQEKGLHQKTLWQQQCRGRSLVDVNGKFTKSRSADIMKEENIYLKHMKS